MTEIKLSNIMQGKTINGFTLQRLLGVGGMAEVWYAENNIGMKAAVKIISERLSHDDQMQERFLNEAKVMVMLDHPNIRKVYGFDQIDGRPAIIMEYLDGADLKAKMKSGQRFTQEELVKWWNQLVDALNYTHAQDIVHRDIKPSNIFIDQRGNVKLLDFGIAKIADTSTGTQTGSTLGTRIYMSPEQVRDPKRVGPPSDVYSLAVSFVHLLTGKAPYDSSATSDFDIQLSIVAKPLDMSLVPADWQSFLKPYLAKELSERAALRHFTVSADATSVSTPPFDSEENRLMMEENRLLKEKYRQLELMMAEQKAKNYSHPVVVSETNDATVSDNMTTVGDLVFTVNGVSFVMKPVKGGTFWMGADDGKRVRTVTVKTGLFKFNEYQKKEIYVDHSVRNYDREANDDESPVHRVTLSTFYMGETVVTQALWMAVMEAEPTYKGGWTDQYGRDNDYPAYNISWIDSIEFIHKLNQLTGKNFRLPTEAEWEYAARGEKKSIGSNSIGNVLAVCDDDSSMKGSSSQDYGTHRVKSKQANGLGLYDMKGNVWEWCGDWYGNYSKDHQINPKGPSSGSDRVLRGGSCGNKTEDCRVTSRNYGGPIFGKYNRGFRLALSM